MKGALMVTLLGAAALLASAWVRQRAVHSFYVGSRGSDSEEIEVNLFPEASESERWLGGTQRPRAKDYRFSNHEKRNIKPDKDEERPLVKKLKKEEESGDESKNVTKGGYNKKGELLPQWNQLSIYALPSGQQDIHLRINITLKGVSGRTLISCEVPIKMQDSWGHSARTNQTVARLIVKNKVLNQVGSYEHHVWVAFLSALTKEVEYHA